MPRPPRLHVPGGCYHVTLRGNHQEDLFSSPADRYALDDITAEALMYYGARLHAYCWMTNHLHMLPQIGLEPLGKLIHRIAVRFARLRHKEMGKTGHLFERRYRAWLVDTDEYFVTLLQYIHLNPVRAGIVQTADDYAWSSHRAYLGEVQVPWITTSFGLSLLGGHVPSARKAYRTMMKQPGFASEEELLGNVHPEDSRILGSDRFVASLPTGAPRSSLSLEELAAQICVRHGLSVDEVRSAARTRSLTPARIDIARRAVAERIASLDQVARYLGRTGSSLRELLQRHPDSNHDLPTMALELQRCSENNTTLMAEAAFYQAMPGQEELP